MVIAVAAVLVVAEHRFKPNQGYGYLIALLYVGCLFTLWAIQDTSVWKYARGRSWRVYQHAVTLLVLILGFVSLVLGVHTTTIGIAGFMVAFAAITIELVAMFFLWRRAHGESASAEGQPAS